MARLVPSLQLSREPFHGDTSRSRRNSIPQIHPKRLSLEFWRTMTLDYGSDPSIMARLGEDNRPGETNRMSTYEFGTIHGRSKSNNTSRSFKTPFGYAIIHSGANSLARERKSLGHCRRSFFQWGCVRFLRPSTAHVPKVSNAVDVTGGQCDAPRSTRRSTNETRQSRSANGTRAKGGEKRDRSG